MARIPLLSLFLICASLLTGCQSEAEIDPECEKLCTALASDCSYRAYPSMDSCLQGCAWEKKQGADIASELSCIESAGCDTFTVIECSHLYGAQAEGR